MQDARRSYLYVPASAGDGSLQSLEAIAALQTGTSCHRTRLSADRTLMAYVRTSISLISFGFTIAQVFQHLHAARLLSDGGAAARNFGSGLVMLGVLMSILGMVGHVSYVHALMLERQAMARAGLVADEAPRLVSGPLVVAFLLLCIGIGAIFTLARPGALN